MAKTFTVKIDTDNAAFGDAWQLETARILRDIADRLEAGEQFTHYQTLRDVNGNEVGRAKHVTHNATGYSNE